MTRKLGARTLERRSKALGLGEDQLAMEVEVDEAGGDEEAGCVVAGELGAGSTWRTGSQPVATGSKHGLDAITVDQDLALSRDLALRIEQGCSIDRPAGHARILRKPIASPE